MVSEEKHNRIIKAYEERILTLQKTADDNYKRMRKYEETIIKLSQTVADICYEVRFT